MHFGMVRKQSLIGIPIFHQLRNSKDNTALTFSLLQAQGSVMATIVNTNQYLNLILFWEDDQEEKLHTERERILQQLVHSFHLTSLNRSFDVLRIVAL